MSMKPKETVICIWDGTRRAADGERDDIHT